MAYVRMLCISYKKKRIKNHINELSLFVVLFASFVLKKIIIDIFENIYRQRYRYDQTYFGYLIVICTKFCITIQIHLCKLARIQKCNERDHTS